MDFTLRSTTALTLTLAVLSPLGCALDGAALPDLDDPSLAAQANPSTGPFGGDYVRLKAIHSGLCLDVHAAGMNAGEYLQQWECKGESNQRFKFVPLATNLFQIIAKHSQLCLAPESTAARATIVQAACSSPRTQFTLSHGSGEFQIVNTSTGYTFDVSGFNAVLGAPVVQDGGNGAANQRFSMLPERSAADREACATSQQRGLAPCKPDAEVPPANVLYGYRTGKGWGVDGDIGNVYYDALDRCSFWHDRGCWAQNGISGPNLDWWGCPNTVNALTCFRQVQPASIEEEVARDAILSSLMPLVNGLVCEPLTIPLYSRYDPRGNDDACIWGYSGPHMEALTLQRWATQQGGFWDTQQWVAGDFNGDGWTDVANVFRDGNMATIDVHRAQRTGTFVSERWATQQGNFWETQQWVAGDFDGDGTDEVAKVFNDAGSASIDVHRSTGASFQMQHWAIQQGGFWDSQKWMAGDFDGDGRTDLMNVFYDGGYVTVDVHRSVRDANGNDSFVYQRWATQIAPFVAGDRWLVGNFDGDKPNGDSDKKAELARVFDDGGLASIDVYLSNGTGFLPVARWATQQGGYWASQTSIAGNVNAHFVKGYETRRDNIMNVFDDDGLATIDVHRSTGSAFVAERWATRQGPYADKQKWLLGMFNKKWEPAKVFNDAGSASIDVHMR